MPVKTREKTLTKSFILITALFFFTTAAGVVLPVVVMVNNYTQNQKVKMAITTASISNQPCIISEVNGQKVYQGCDIDYSQFNTKSATNMALVAKLKALPKDRQAELNFELKQTQTAIEARGGTWTAGWNAKMILSDAEQKKLLGLLGKPPTLPPEPKSVTKDATLPDSFDWRNVGGKNYITLVKDQGQCGSCWAFGADAAFEGHIQAYYNNSSLMSDLAHTLAEQDLVSCALPYPSDGVGGCEGAYDYQIENIFSTYWINPGNTTGTYFPYTATDAACSTKRAGWDQYAWRDLSYKKIDLTANLTDNINKIKRAVIENGPVDAGMDVYSDFFDYQSGIYQHDPDADYAGGHSVTIVGFGKYDGRDYWVVKNSWGPTWGENGYFKIYANDSNISFWHAFVVNGPNPPTTQSVVCTDNDSGGADGYCYWGIGSKPETGCPSSCDSQPIEDCDDSNANLNDHNCGKITDKVGSLPITTTPDNAEVYIKDVSTGIYVFRGQTPLTINLNVGYRQILIKKEGYYKNSFNVNVVENENPPININLTKDPRWLTNWPVHGLNQNDYNSSDVLLSDINNDGLKEIIVYIGFNARIYAFEPSGQLLTNWPVNLSPEGKYHNTTNNYPNYSPIIGDINGDKNDEVIYKLADCIVNNKITGWAFNSLGNELWNNPCLNCDGIWWSHPISTINNLENDTTNEMINFSSFIGDQRHILISQNSQIIKNSPIILPSDQYKSFSYFGIDDIDNDGKKEIITVALNCVTGDNGFIYIYNTDGSLKKTLLIRNPSIYKFTCSSMSKLILTSFPNGKAIGFMTHIRGVVFFYDLQNGSFINGWPKVFLSANGYGSEIESVDLLGDDAHEIIINGEKVSTGQNFIYLYDSSGHELPNWPIISDGFSTLNSPAVADINGDAKPEIIVGQSNYIYAYDLAGHLISGFPIEVDDEIQGSPALSDVDNDGYIELFISTYSGKIYGFRLGRVVSDKIYWPMAKHDPQATNFSPPLMCHDNDIKNYYLKDKTFGNYLQNDTPLTDWWQDYCVDSSQVADFTCAIYTNPSTTPGKVIADKYSCPHGCNDGACNCAYHFECPNGYACNTTTKKCIKWFPCSMPSGKVPALSLDLVMCYIPGTLFGGATSTATYLYNSNAYVFNGSTSYISVDDTRLNITNAITVSAWINMSDPVANQTHQNIILAKQDYANKLGYTLGLNKPYSNNLFFRIHYGTGLNEAHWDASGLPANTWHHIVGTYDKVNIKLYVDDILVATQPLNYPIGITTNPLQIGAAQSTNVFNGIIDHVRVFYSALSAAEIDTLFKAKN